MEGVIEAKSVSQINGEIILSGGKNSGVVRVASKVKATGKNVGQKGGNVTVTGYNILIDDPALIDVSGDAGGGNIYIGGNYQGKGPLPNANAVVMLSGAKIKADALTNGDGGEIILWSDNLTKAYGSLSARGGIYSGNGGLIETSSHNYLDINGLEVNTSSLHGKSGTWLLDPTNIYIALNQTNATAAGISGSDSSADTGSGVNPTTFAASGVVQDSLLTTGTLTTALGTTDV